MAVISYHPIVAALFGFTNIAEGAAAIAKVLFFIFIVLFLLAIIAGTQFSRNLNE